MDVPRLAVLVLQHIAVAAVQATLHAIPQRAGVVARLRTSPARFDTGQHARAVFRSRIAHPGRAHATAVATPCWPAPVSAMTRCLPIRRVNSACTIVLLIL